MRGPARLLLVLSLAGCAVAPGPAPLTLPGPSPPVPPPIVSGFGDTGGPGGIPRPWPHAGIDIPVPLGTPVLAAADGTVLRAGEGGLGGKTVVVTHGDLATFYLHLSEIAVRPGQVVRRGEPIGRAGMTGNATAPHLHFGVCRRPGARCGPAIDAGWADPTGYWVPESPCYERGRAYPTTPPRLTYPLSCRPADG